VGFAGLLRGDGARVGRAVGAGVTLPTGNGKAILNLGGLDGLGELSPFSTCPSAADRIQLVGVAVPVNGLRYDTKQRFFPSRSLRLLQLGIDETPYTFVLDEDPTASDEDIVGFVAIAAAVEVARRAAQALLGFVVAGPVGVGAGGF